MGVTLYTAKTEVPVCSSCEQPNTPMIGDLCESCSGSTKDK